MSSSGGPTDTDSIGALLGSGLFLPWYYAAQAGSALSPEQAAAHFLEHGWQEGLLANPLLDFDATGLSPDRVRSDLLDGSAGTYPVRPLFDDLEFVATTPASVHHRGGPVGFFLERAEQGHAGARIGSRSWRDFVALRKRHGRTLGLIEVSGLFDQDHYERQAGRAFAGLRAAIWHFLETGEGKGLSAHPLFEQDWYRRRTGGRSVGAFADFLRSGQVRGAAGPHFDARTYLAEHPEAAEHRGGALGHFCSLADKDTLTPADTGVEPMRLGEVLQAVATAAATYGEQARLVSDPPRRWARWYVAREPRARPAGDQASRAGERVCVVTDVRLWHDAPTSALAGLRGQSHTAWRLRVAVDKDHDVPRELAEASAEDPRITFVTTSAESDADRANAVVEASDESWCAFWNPRQAWSPTMLTSLLAAVPDGGAAMGEVVVDGDEPEWLGPVRGDEGALWRRPRTLAGVVVARTLLGTRPFRTEAGAVYQWEFLLRSRLEPDYVPFVAVRCAGEEVVESSPGLENTDHHALRATRLVSWEDVRASLASRVPGRTSLLIPTYRDWRYTRQAVRTALAAAGGGDVEAVVVDNGSRREVIGILGAVFASDERVRLHRLPVNTNFATGSNVAFARSTGDRVVFLNNDTEPRDGWLEPLTGVLDEPGVLGAQPVLLYPDDTIQTAGTVFYGPNSIPGHFLASFPQEDLRPEIQLRFSAVTAACMAVKAAVVADARGFDPHYANGMEDVDLCLRLVRDHAGHFVTVRDSVVVHHESKSPGRFARSESNRLRFLEVWRSRLPAPETDRWVEAGFEVTALRAVRAFTTSGARTAAEPVLRRPATTVAEGPGRGLPRLRWAIKIAAWGGPRGDGWGDVAFARDVAEALRSWGQEVVVDRAGAHERPPSDYLDDVTLTLRGLVRTQPQPGATNLLWVISHPELVTADELTSGYDVVYAASALWSQDVSQQTGQEVKPLLQATNVARFRPEGPAMDDVDVLFVGRTRRVFRPIVRDALAVGADLALFGDGWEEFIDPALVRGDHLPNDELPAAYRGARIVLNDHWEDMARQGFFSNRLFDAAASGARVVSDDVPGLDELFGPSVQVYRSRDELADLLAPGSTRWAPDEAIRQNAARVATAHSFQERARGLLADVLDRRGVPHSLRDPE